MDNEIKTAAEAVESDALPRCHEVHSDPTRSKAKAESLPESVKAESVAQKSPAQWAYERTVLYLKNFEEQLDNEHEVAMGFAGGDAGVLRIEGMGYFDPDIVTFYGTDPAGGRTQLVQHVSQLNVMLRALPNAKEGAAPNRIGFRLVEDLEKSQDEVG
ncbi:hypothetical protein HKX54_13860 [Sulfitobacter sp. M57]|uniref:DUF6173 family protein n=1 Tax=unclassified Sulfitobacter TaxID=196795 RepID=UPI0023E205F3|nr:MULTISPECIES: DUF6173 family protein [unclassified Sulfitobacter]MDF3415551.1 hypothetical protein [Sulfitobacter sp. KE5]MDF3423032.1 hypothetical protein [Sulfitobacter sp. KE43]MDF3434097.1 hypothetical protein [Sulfitobacter sp. KE42]MDF3459870.1 hypothetical protein [Sulfitobacter sp. S74]MDF3463636.1 hypothetical protein [Sulfitobacter sp. Ks18]